MNPVLVLLHAFPLDNRIWKHQIESLSDDYQVIAPNLNGIGEIDLVADTVAGLIPGKAAVAGISRGGYIAMSLARRHPQVLSGLVLLDTRATPADAEETKRWTQMSERLQTDGIGFLPEVMLPRILGPSALARRPDLVAQLKEIILGQNPEEIAAAARGMASRPDAAPFLKDIAVPVMAIAGVQDAAFESTKAIAAAIPNAEFVEVFEAGHLSNVEQPEIVTGLIRRFLRTL